MAATLTIKELLEQTGFQRDPSGRKWGGTGLDLKCEIKKSLRIVDEQDAVNRYTWYNLPAGLNGQLLERILYYKGQGAFFYMETADKFLFLPYALDGSIDVYGRFTGITPLPFGGTTKADEKPKAWIDGLILEPSYDVILPEDLTYDDLMKKCVLLQDYTPQISQTVLPRAALQDSLVDVMADCVPFMRTALKSATGVAGMRVATEDEYSNVLAASYAHEQAALKGDKWVPIVGQIDFQDLSTSNVGTAEDFLIAMQSLDNLRLSLHGLDNGGLFQKRSHMLQAEQETNNTNVGLVLQDGLTNRQRFCDIVNSIWDLGIYVDVSETVKGIDQDGDGVQYDKFDQSGRIQGEQPQMPAPMEVEG